MLSDCEAITAAIGRRLGEMHAVLARESADEAFAPTNADADDAANWTRKAERRLDKAFAAMDAMRDWYSRIRTATARQSFLKLRARIGTAVQELAKSGAGTLMTRIHGDFHLGQVLVASGDVYIIDFEGEPATSIAERRAKTSPLRDVAGLLRSIDYAGATLIDRKGVGAVPIDEAQRDHLIAEFRAARLAGVPASTIGQRAAPAAVPMRRALLDLFLIEKAAYEITYEAANRPTWIGVPLAGLSALATRILEKEAAGGRDG